MSTPRFIDIHLLQTVPYANLNRDDLGTPKQLVYGGVTRTRVSSQCWKRAVRLAVEAALGDRAVRTRRLADGVAKQLVDRGWPQELAALAGQQVIAAAELKSGKKDATSVLVYVPAVALAELADLAEEHRDKLAPLAGKQNASKSVLPAERVTAILTRRNSTISLFGRMLAELPGAQVDGVVQVAHAFTTHETEPEIDFFTAVDDLNPAEDHGSGHLNSAEFSAGVFYRYANLDLHGLRENLGGDTAAARELTSEFLHAFLASLPTGKQTATAPATLPDLAYVAVRADRPVSLAPAFEAPVRAEALGWAEPSRRELARYADRLHTLWGTGGIAWHGYACIDEKPLRGLGEPVDSFPALLRTAVAAAYPGGTP